MAKVFITKKIPQEAANILLSNGFVVESNAKDKPLSKKELKKVFKNDYDAVLTLLNDGIDSEVLNGAKNVKIISNYATGFNNVDAKAAAEKDIAVANSPTSKSSESVAEHTIGLMLSISRRICEGDTYIRRKKFKGWDPAIFLGDELMGRTLSIIGAGNIGRRVASIAAKGLKMKIAYYDVVRSEELESEVDAEFCPSLGKAMEAGDYVSVHVPLNDETRHLISKEMIMKMKQTAYLVNTSRGSVVDESALAEALDQKKIKGAAIDVFEFEPKVTKTLLKLSNIVMTPHIASSTEAARAEMAKVAAQNIVDFLKSGYSKNIVNGIGKTQESQSDEPVSEKIAASAL